MVTPSKSILIQMEQVGELLEEAAEQWGDREAIVSCQQGIRKTYSQVVRQSSRPVVVQTEYISEHCCRFCPRRTNLLPECLPLESILGTGLAFGGPTLGNGETMKSCKGKCVF